MSTAFQNIPNKPTVDWEYFAGITQFAYFYNGSVITIDRVCRDSNLEKNTKEELLCESVLGFCCKYIKLLAGSTIGSYTAASLLNELTNAKSAHGASLAFPCAIEYFHPDTAQRFFSDWHTQMELTHLRRIVLTEEPTSTISDEEHWLISGFVHDLQTVAAAYLGSTASPAIPRSALKTIGQRLELLDNLPDRDYNFAAIFGFKTFFVDQPQETTVTTQTFVPLAERANINWSELIAELKKLKVWRDEEESKDRSFDSNGYPGAMSENFYTLQKAIANHPEATRLFKDCFVSPEKGTIDVIEMFSVFSTAHFKSLVFDLCTLSSALHFLPKGLSYNKAALENVSNHCIFTNGKLEYPANSRFQPLVSAIGSLAISYLNLDNNNHRFQDVCLKLSDDVQWPDGFKFWDVLRYMLDGPTLGLFYTVILRRAENDVDKNDGSSFQILEDNTRTTGKILTSEGEQVVRLKFDNHGRMSVTSESDTPAISPVDKVLTSYGITDVKQTIDYIAIINNRADVLLSRFTDLTNKKIPFPYNIENPSGNMGSTNQIQRIANMRLAYQSNEISTFIINEIGVFWSYVKSVDASLDAIGVTANCLFLIYRDWMLYQFINKTFDSNDPDVTIEKIASFV